MDIYIDHLKEYSLLQSLMQKLPNVDPYRTLVINVSPDYSSTVAMQIAHYLSDHGKMLDLFELDVPYPGESKEPYLHKFKKEFEERIPKYNKVVLCEAAVLSGKNYTWIKETLLEYGYKSEDIITVALLEMETSVFKSDFVGEYIDRMPEFYWERYNKNWN
jgi:hypothetical protein